MARVRNLKPGFFSNEDLAECSCWARLCFAGLWTIADREGRLEDRPKRIMGQLFPMDTVDVEPLLGELEQHGFIFRYQHEGKAYIQVVSFHKHQNPHFREPPSTIPSPESLGLMVDSKITKPEASNSIDGHEASDKPGAFPSKVDIESPQSRAEPGTRNPEPGKEEEREKPPKLDSGAGKRSAKPQLSLPAWLAALGDGDAIPADDAVYRYADETGIPDEFIALAWDVFAERMTEGKKRQKDWRQHFRNAVKGNWFKLWWMPPTGGCELTTAGIQAQRAAEARDAA